MPTNFKLSPEKFKKLNYERYHYPYPIVQKKMHCLYLKGSLNLANAAIGEIIDAHRNSISEWIKIYTKDGFNAIIKIGYSTNERELEKHSSSIIEVFTNHSLGSLGEAIIKIEALTKIKRSLTSINNFMKPHKFKFLKTGHIPVKVNTNQQTAWVNDTLKPLIAAAQQEKVHLLFLYVAHFTLQPFLCCLWCVSRIFIKASPDRNRINVLGAVNAITNR
jgi:transposase